MLKARTSGAGPQAPFAPAPIDEVVATIRRDKPELVFAPHVETSAGMMLPDDYLRAVADAVHAHGGLFVLDCVASGAMWVDMAATGVDVLVSAPQKGWSSTPCAGLVMLGAAARERIDGTTSSSFSMDLKKWLSIMETHEKGQIAYHATLPTDGLTQLRDVMQDTAAFGFDAARAAQQAIGTRVRALLEARGIRSVAAAGFQAPCVIVSYTERSDFQNTQAFAEAGPAGGRRRAAGLRRRAGLQDLPPRPVRPGQAAEPGPHRGHLRACARCGTEGLSRYRSVRSRQISGNSTTSSILRR